MANISLKEAAVRLRKATNETARKSWNVKTESLNFENGAPNRGNENVR